MKDKWRKALLKLKSQLRSMYDADLYIRHGVVLSASKSETEIGSVIELLEPAYVEERLEKSISVETDGCSYHGHYFFAKDPRGLNQLERLLSGLGDWIEEIPKGILPQFDIPSTRTQTESNLLHWSSIVYFLAWEYDEVYLQAQLEHLDSIPKLPFQPWIECPQPNGCDPRSWMIHLGKSSGRVSKWQKQFEERELHFPDLISAYLTNDLIFSSLAALDSLLYRNPKDERESPSETGTKSNSNSKRGKNARLDWKNMLFLLMEHFREHFEAGAEPLTQEEISEQLEWNSQARVHRRMKQFFPGGWKGYKRMYETGEIPKGFGTLDDEGRVQPDREVDGEPNLD